MKRTSTTTPEQALAAALNDNIPAIHRWLTVGWKETMAEEAELLAAELLSRLSGYTLVSDAEVVALRNDNERLRRIEAAARDVVELWPEMAERLDQRVNDLVPGLRTALETLAAHPGVLR